MLLTNLEICRMIFSRIVEGRWLELSSLPKFVAAIILWYINKLNLFSVIRPIIDRNVCWGMQGVRIINDLYQT